MTKIPQFDSFHHELGLSLIWKGSLSSRPKASFETSCTGGRRHRYRLGRVNRLEEFIRELPLPRMADLGLDKGAYAKKARQMAKDALASGSPANNPRLATEEEIEALYLAAWEA